jgi:D-alanyl-lipoteichoic acid acyltransferase DltB (MBOAT superfamily)
LSLAANLGLLATFKYLDFTLQTLEGLAHMLGVSLPAWQFNLLLPIGLSFHTFQSMSYTIEVYRGKQKAITDFILYALYVMFYCQLVAGPIERPQNVLPQFDIRQRFDYGRVTSGLKLMTWGLFKKVVIADQLAVLVNQVYKSPSQWPGGCLLVATICFSYQIYCDFSGYSDIALGAAEVMGFRLMRNFDRPYLSKNISEFWRRWHISLSTWFRDYLYIPLGGSRVILPRRYFNLMLTFMVSGLWHGANWTFVVWGALNGFYLVVEQAAAAPLKRLGQRLGADAWPILARCCQVAKTFVLITFAWIFFRADSMADGLYIASHVATGMASTLTAAVQGRLAEALDLSGLARLPLGPVIPASLVVLCAVEWLQRTGSVRVRLQELSPGLRWMAYQMAIFAILIFGQTNAKFIYFQF